MSKLKSYNPVNFPVLIKCEGAEAVPLEILTGFQGNLKRLTQRNRDRLAKSILKQGFIAPIFVWNQNGKKLILDGHQRLETLKYLKSSGWEIPDIPIAYIEADDEEDARRKLLHITSQYGDFVQEELQDWLEGFEEDLTSSLRFVDGEMNLLKGLMDGTDLAGDLYTKKIKSPIYEIKGENPKIPELVNQKKTKELIQRIRKADIQDKALEAFLILSAYRHLVFSYEKIAEFYAHAEPEIQDLMEQSALVLIDLDKAIEGGFVTLTDEFATVFDADSPGELTDDAE